MKRKTTCLLLFSILIAIQVTARSKPQVIAHRGFWKYEGSAQNSVKALKLSDDIGVYGSEFDVHMTADGKMVVFHDDKILSIPIQTANYVDVENLRLSNWDKLPTLEEYLNKARVLSTKLIFELKPHATPERNREAARLSVDMVKKAGLLERTEFITFNLDAGKEFIRLVPETPVYYLNGDLSPKQLKELGFTGLDYNYRVMKDHPEWFKEAKELGLLINVWTVNDSNQIKEMIEMGADFITTDQPVEAQQIIYTSTE